MIRIPCPRALSLALVAVLTAASALLGISAITPAHADGDHNTGRTAPSMLVLDASGSMRADDVGGRSRMDVAKEAVTSLVPMLPDDASVGLITYGNSTPEVARNKARGCEDVKVIVPAQGLDAAALTNGVKSVKPSGFTPIGKSLQVAAKELPKAEMRSIVLVSDGIDECGGPPPCEVAKGLAKDHPELRIHTIGFKAEQQARNALACIAEATGGTFADASDAETLREELLVKMTRALQGYETAGKAVHGGVSLKEAAPIEPGSYLDVLEHGSDQVDDGQGFSRFYRITLGKGEIGHIAATMVLPPGSGDSSTLTQLRVRVRGEDGTDCRVTKAVARSATGISDGPITATVQTPRMGESRGRTCFGNESKGSLIVEVERTGAPLKDEAVPLELQFFAEQNVDAERLPAAARDVVTQEPLAVPTEGERITPAFSYASATLSGSVPMRGTIIPGEVQFFRVPVKYGQQVRAAVSVGDFDLPPGMGLTLQMRMFSPLRAPVYSTPLPGTSASTDGVTVPLTPGLKAQANQAVPVQFKNREHGGEEARTSFLSGDYYVQVAVVPSRFDASRLFEVPYVLDIDVVGKESKGPVLTGQGDLEDRSASDPGAAPGAAPSDGGGDVELEDPPEQQATIPSFVWIIVGGMAAGVVLMGAAIGGVLLIRRMLGR